MINKSLTYCIPKMKLSFYFVLIAIIGFLMTAHIDCHQKRQESQGEDEDGPPAGGVPSVAKPSDRDR